jgi:hypothetical protein
MNEEIVVIVTALVTWIIVGVLAMAGEGSLGADLGDFLLPCDPA